MKYFEEAKHIWTNLVPKSGQADNLQGELLRQIEKLRYEAQDNGNINWDSSFEYFCNFLDSTLCASEIFSNEEKLAVTSALTKIKTAGQLAYRFNNGEISDDELAKQYNYELAYVDDALYDVVVDAIATLYMHHKKPIPFKPNPEIYR